MASAGAGSVELKGELAGGLCAELTGEPDVSFELVRAQRVLLFFGGRVEVLMALKDAYCADHAVSCAAAKGDHIRQRLDLGRCGEMYGV